MSGKNNDLSFMIPLLIALSSAGVFGLMFLAMGYFELVGADPTYFDDGTQNNMNFINSALGIVGFKININEPHTVSTTGYAICYGIAMLFAGVSIIFANRQNRDTYEVTDAKK